MKCCDLNRNNFKTSDEKVDLLVKPTVPLVHRLRNKLYPSSSIIFQGIVEDDAQRFEVNLVTGHGERPDIAFHFNPRLDKLYTALNSRFNGSWGNEEGLVVGAHRKFPFRCGQPFYLETYVTDTKFLVAVNGTHYYTYKYRTSLSNIVGIQVNGSVRLSQVVRFSTSTYPSPLPQLLAIPEDKPSNRKVHNKEVEVFYNVKSCLQPHSSIIVQGVVNETGIRFEVNFLSRHGDKERPDIVFHFNPRLDLHYTARNSRLEGKWGSEEGDCEENFPFRCGFPFYIEIYITAPKFLIAVDGIHYCTYKHRAVLRDIIKVQVRGGVSLANVLLQSTFNYPSPLPTILGGVEDNVVLQAAGDCISKSKLKVPFTHQLKSTLHPRSAFIIYGVVNNNALRFEVNLIIGYEEKYDIAFHFNPRFDQLYTARNSRFNGTWGREEGSCEREFPFHHGQPFFLEIYLTESQFMVAVDGDHYCSYKYRSSLVSITSIQINGGITLTEVKMYSSSNYPSPMPESLPLPDVKPTVLKNDPLNPDAKTVPYIHKLESRFYPETSLVIRGAVPDTGLRFAINLLIDYEHKQDIAFHFNPRLNQMYTARNSRFSGNWGTEEGSPKEKFPFKIGEPFYIEIFFSHSKFKVAVDGNHYCHFKYRGHLAKVSTIQIEGAVKVDQVLVHSTSSYPSPKLDFICSEKVTNLQSARTISSSSINQVLPFYHELKSGLHPQSDILVQGVVDLKAMGFEINFLKGRGERPDIAFHFNPRLDQFYVARNARLEGTWGPEEGNSQHKFPFARGKSFYIEIFLDHSEFLVAVNGIHYCTFEFRTPLRTITCIQLKKVRDPQVEVKPASVYPSPAPSEYCPSPYRIHLHANTTSVYSTQITPLYGLLKGKLKTNSRIEINGKVKLLPYLFYVNLQEGSDYWPHPVIPFHVSVRFCQGGEQVTVANSWVHKKWGPEEVIRNKYYFTPGYPFKLVIRCLEDKFLLKVDDEVLLTFKYRLPFRNVDTLLIQGDVFIYDIVLDL